MGTLPIDRLRAAWFKLIHGVPRGESAPCRYCASSVPAHEGERNAAGVYCDTECSSMDFERTA